MSNLELCDERVSSWLALSFRVQGKGVLLLRCILSYFAWLAWEPKTTFISEPGLYALILFSTPPCTPKHGILIAEKGPKTKIQTAGRF